MSDSISLCTGTVSNVLLLGSNVPSCDVAWVSAPYSYSASIGSTMTVDDVVELSWLVVACLVAGFAIQQLKRVP